MLGFCLSLPEGHKGVGEGRVVEEGKRVRMWMALSFHFPHFILLVHSIPPFCCLKCCVAPGLC